MSQIDDGETLYRYVKPDVLPIGQEELPASIFNDSELSCDWKKLQSAPNLSPHVKNGKRLIVSIEICDGIRNPVNPKQTNVVVAEWKQDIIHDPKAAVETDIFTPNPSHALIKGKKKGAVTTAIRDNSTYTVVPAPS